MASTPATRPDHIDPQSPPETPARPDEPSPVSPPETEPVPPDFDQPDVSPDEFPAPNP